jgi:hypothetical protein
MRAVDLALQISSNQASTLSVRLELFGAKTQNQLESHLTDKLLIASR